LDEFAEQTSKSGTSEADRSNKRRQCKESVGKTPSLILRFLRKGGGVIGSNLGLVEGRCQHAGGDI
jgi:hypothetical protein